MYHSVSGTTTQYIDCHELLEPVTQKRRKRHKQASQETGKENKTESPEIDRENKLREHGQEEKKY